MIPISSPSLFDLFSILSLTTTQGCKSNLLSASHCSLQVVLLSCIMALRFEFGGAIRQVFLFVFGWLTMVVVGAVMVDFGPRVVVGFGTNVVLGF